MTTATIPEEMTVPAFRLEATGDAGRFHAIPDLDHPFYFDHPLGHLPGLLLLDMAFAAVSRATSSDDETWFTRFETRFQSLAALDLPVELQVGPADADGARRCILSQDGKPRVHFTGIAAPALTAPGAASASKARRFSPAPQESVRKLRPENVFLGTTDDTGRWCLPAAEDVTSALGAARGDFCRPIYLAECFLQLCRANRKEDILTPGEVPASREILVRLGGTLPVPVPASAPLTIAFTKHHHVGETPAHPRALQRTASVFQGDDSVAHFFCDAIPF